MTKPPPRPDKPRPSAYPQPQSGTQPQPGAKLQAAGETLSNIGSAIIWLVVIAVMIGVWQFCGSILDAGTGREGPAPGSMGAQMCDVHRDRTNPDHVEYDGVWYSSECLLQYP